MKEEIKLLKSICKKAEDNQYPGYPFQLTGFIDMGEQKGYFGSHGRPMSLEKFYHDFDSEMAFPMLGSHLAQKGNWYNGGTLMAEYQKFISHDTSYDDFYIDDINAVKLYFGLYSAIRQFKDTNKLIWFIVDNDCDYVDIQVFDNAEQIKHFIKEYWTEEE